MPKYDIDYPDGQKFTFESKRELSPKELEKAVQQHAQVVTERKVGDVTERTISAKVGSPTPAKRPPSELATDFGEPEEPRSKQFMRNAYNDIAATPSKDIFDYVNEVFEERRQDRGRMKMGPLKLGSDALDLARNVALAPITIPKALGEGARRGLEESKRKGEFPGIGIGKELGKLGIAALPFGGEILEAATTPKSLKQTIAESFSQSPVGMGLDVIPGAALAKVGQLAGKASIAATGAAISRFAPETTPRISGVSSSSPRQLVSSTALPPLRPSPRRDPVVQYHHDPVDIQSRRLMGRQHPNRGEGSPESAPRLDRMVYSETDEILRGINESRGLPSDHNMDRVRVNFNEWEQSLKNDPNGVLTRLVDDTLQKASNYQKTGRQPNPIDSPEELLAANIAIRRLEEKIWGIQDEMDAMAEGVDRSGKQAQLEATQDALFAIEVYVRRPYVSQAGRTLAYQKYHIADPWSLEKALRQTYDYINKGKSKKVEVSIGTRRALARITGQYRRNHGALVKHLEENVEQSSGDVRKFLEDHKDVIAEEAKLSSELKVLRKKKSELESKVLAEVKKEVGLDPDTHLDIEATKRFLREPQEPPQKHNLPTPEQRAEQMMFGRSFAQPATTKGGGPSKKQKSLEKAPDTLDELDKAIEAKEKKRKGLADTIKARMAESVKEYESNANPPPPPLAEKKRQSTKGMTRPEIQARSQQNKELAKTASDEKKAARKRALEAEADKKINAILDNLGADEVSKPAVTPIISADHVRRLREVANLRRSVNTIKKNLGTYLDEDMMSDLWDKAAEVYRSEGNTAARKLLADATADARKIVANDRARARAAKKRESTADERLEKLGEPAPVKNKSVDDHGTRVSKLSVIAGAMKRAYDGKAPADEITAAIEKAKELYKADPTATGFEAAKAELQSIRAKYRGDKASAEMRDRAKERLDTLGRERPKVARNPLADEATLAFARDTRSLDAMAQTYRKKYGVELGEGTLFALFDEAAKKLRDHESEYHLDQVKGELVAAVESEIKKHRTFKMKAWDAVKEFNDIQRAVMASSDVSYIGRQVGLAAAAHPVIAAKSAIPGLKTLGKSIPRILKDPDTGKPKVSTLDDAREYIHKVEGEILTSAVEKYRGVLQQENIKAGRDENFDIDRAEHFYSEVAGLDFTVPPPDLKSGWFSLLTDKNTRSFGADELTSGVLRNTPILKDTVGRVTGASDLAFAAGRNWAMTHIFDAIYKPEKGMTIEDAKSIGKLVNSLTGRSNYSGPWMQALGPVFFSPGYTFSRVEYGIQAGLSLFGLNPFYNPYDATGMAKAAIRKEMAKIAAAYTAFYGAVASARMAGADIEVGTDPTSPTWGMIKLPSGGWFDPTAGEKPYAVALGQYGFAHRTNLAGKERATDAYDIAARGVRSKLGPGLSGVFSMYPPLDPGEWKDFNGRKLVPEGEARKLVKAWGFVPTDEAIRASEFALASAEMAKKSVAPLGFTQMMEDIGYYARKEGLQPHEAAWVAGHAVSNFFGYPITVYDAKRGGTPNRKRGGSGLSLPKLPRLDAELPRL